ncbi:MAG: hypothetical protein ACRDT0_27605 [Pseudonocardiaceae bacterium]
MADEEPTAQENADDADAAAGPSGGDERPPRSRRYLAALATLTVLAVVLIVGGVILSVRVYQADVESDRRAEALQTARQMVLNLTTINHKTADRDVQRLLDGATGPFADEFGGSQPFVDMVRQSKVNSTGQVASAGVERVDENRARVLVAVRSEVRNTAAPEGGEPRNYRLGVDLQREGDRWLVSNMEFIQ